jgi:hypothetical protein
MKQFENVVTTEQELREIIGRPIPRVLLKDRIGLGCTRRFHADI